MAIVRVRHLKVPATIGVYEHERRQPQTLVVDVEVAYDATRAAASDQLADAVDYEALCRQVTQMAGARSFTLLETFAAAVLAVVRGFPGVTRARVCCGKPGAIPAATTVEVELAWP